MRGNAQWKQTNGPDGCPITAFASRDSILFAGHSDGNGGGGGLYVSLNNGNSWQVLSSDLLSEGVRELAMKDTNLYAATSRGVILSTDNGSSWISSSQDISNLSILTVAVSGDKLFAGGSRGIFVSTDNGANWDTISIGIENPRINRFLVQGAIIYAGTTGNGVYRSLDSGMNWVEVSTGLKSKYIYSLAGLGGHLYAGTDKGMFVSTDNGENWNLNGLSQFAITLDTIDNNLFAGTSTGILFSSDYGQSWTERSNGIGIYPVLSFLKHGTYIYAGTSAGMFRSLTNDTHWYQITNGLIHTDILSLHAYDTCVFAGTNSDGIFRTTDNGYSWEQKGLGYSSRQIVAIAECSGYLFSASKVLGVYVRTNNGGDWSAYNTNLDNTIIESLVANDSFLFASSPGGVGVLRNKPIGNDSVVWGSWVRVNSGLPSRYIYEMAVSGSNLFAVVYEGIYLSTNNGSSWNAVNNSGFTNTSIVTLWANGGILFAGTSSEGVFRTTDNGASWEAVNSGLSNLVIYELTSVKSNLFVSTGSGIFVSSNNGNNWKHVNDGLEIYPYPIKVLVGNDSNLFAGTLDAGVWRRPLSEMINTNAVQSLPTSNISSTAYPNPLTTSTTINYTLPERDNVTVEVFDILGRKIQTLANEVMDAGPHSVVFNGENLPLGMYTVKITSGASSEEMKVVLSK